MMISTAIALIPAQSTVNCAVKSIRPTGIIFDAVVRISWLASAYSFHEVRNAKIATEARPEHTNRNSIFQNAYQRVQPSICTASKRSTGICQKKPSVGQIVKGMLIAR